QFSRGIGVNAMAVTGSNGRRGCGVRRMGGIAAAAKANLRPASRADDQIRDSSDTCTCGARSTSFFGAPALVILRLGEDCLASKQKLVELGRGSGRAVLTAAETPKSRRPVRSPRLPRVET